MTPRVKYIIYNYMLGNLKAVNEYLTQSQMIIDPSTWAGHIKGLLEEKKEISAMAEIELMLFKFNFFKNEKKNNDIGKDTNN